MITDKTARTSSYKAMEAATSLKTQAGNVAHISSLMAACKWPGWAGKVGAGAGRDRQLGWGGLSSLQRKGQ